MHHSDGSYFTWQWTTYETHCQMGLLQNFTHWTFKVHSIHECFCHLWNWKSVCLGVFLHRVCTCCYTKLNMAIFRLELCSRFGHVGIMRVGGGQRGGRGPAVCLTARPPRDFLSASTRRSSVAVWLLSFLFFPVLFFYCRPLVSYQNLSIFISQTTTRDVVVICHQLCWRRWGAGRGRGRRAVSLFLCHIPDAVKNNPPQPPKNDFNALKTNI